MKMKTLIFDVRGDYGHFRTYFSTSSPVTFALIPPTAVLGIVGAILGYSRENNEYLRILKQTKVKVAVKLINPIKKVRMGINLINTKGNIWIPKHRREGPRTPIKYEFLKEPAYRIFVAMEDEKVFYQLVEMVKSHKTYYTVSLGLSELLADFSYVDVKNFILVKENDDFVRIDSVVPLKMITEDGVMIKEGMKYLKERIPFVMDEDRIVEKYEEILLEMQGRPLPLKVKQYWKCEQENINIVFLQ